MILWHNKTFWYLIEQNIFKNGHVNFLYSIGFGKETINIAKNKFDMVPLT